VVTQRYFRPYPTPKVVVTGSTFYDAEHSPGSFGPTSSHGQPARKAVTQWEIHPVHSIAKE
jgi:hypothetical protein